jgi:hypothetical protein
MILCDGWNYIYQKYSVQLVITQTRTSEWQDKQIGRISSSHREGRAVDIRTKDVDSYIIADLIDYINCKEDYKEYHYVSNQGIKRLAYWHVGTAEHIHLALHSKYKTK